MCYVPLPDSGTRTPPVRIVATLYKPNTHTHTRAVSKRNRRHHLFSCRTEDRDLQFRSSIPDHISLSVILRQGYLEPLSGLNSTRLWTLDSGLWTLGGPTPVNCSPLHPHGGENFPYK